VSRCEAVCWQIQRNETGIPGQISALRSEEICQTDVEGEERRQARSSEEIAVPTTPAGFERSATALRCC
jgi:hypothetical protein